MQRRIKNRGSISDIDNKHARLDSAHVASLHAHARERRDCFRRGLALAVAVVYAVPVVVAATALLALAMAGIGSA